MFEEQDSLFGYLIPPDIPSDIAAKMITARWAGNLSERDCNSLRTRWGTESGFLAAVEHIYEYNDIKFSANEIRWWKFFLQGNDKPGDPSKLPKRVTKKK
jgi:hypothetical protein